MNISLPFGLPTIRVPFLPSGPADPEMDPGMAALTRARNFLYDTQIDQHEDLCRLIGLPPMSPDVAASERAASDTRSAKITPITPLLHAHAHTLVACVTAYFAERAGEAVEDWTSFVESVEPIAYAALLGSVTQLVHHDILRQGKEFPA